MIPLPVNIPWRLIGAAAVVAVIGLGLWRFGNSRYEAGYAAAEALWQAEARAAGERYAEALAAQQRLLERSDAALTEARRQGRINREELDDALATPEGRSWGDTPLPDGVRLSLNAARHPPVPGDPD